MTTTSASPQRTWRIRLRQKTAQTARWLHLYLSMVSFAIVLFFSVTGLTVNHPNWFSGAVKTRLFQGSTDRDMLRAGEVSDPAKSPLVLAIRSREHLHGAVDEIRIDDTAYSFSYRAPGYSADVSVDRSSGRYSGTEVRNGFVAVVNDLHKGRDAGKVWGWLIDASAVLLTLVSVTGLLILWFIYKRRTSGLLIAAAGLGVCALIYKVFVP